MPLHGKIVVIKRSGGDGTAFPLTATCLFGRKPDCDIRIQLPQVSKEHCRIDLNENKEVVLTNLSSVNPIHVNGEVLQQSERLKHGDVITVIDRSFRFEYPPAPTPKKRSSKGGKTETLKVRQDQQVGDKGEKRVSNVSTDPHLKDGTNHDNIKQPAEKTVELESKEDGSMQQNETNSPFNDLYQMVKQSLDVKTPRKSSVSLLQTPSSRFCTPRPGAVRNDVKPVVFCEDNTTTTPQKDKVKVLTEDENEISGTAKKQRKSSPTEAAPGPTAEEVEPATKSEATSPRRRNSATPQKFSVPEVIEKVTTQTPKAPVRRRSKEGTPARAASPRNSGKSQEKSTSKRRKSGELGTDVLTQEMKKKRVSFGGHLSPELFDKRLPPDSPLCKGATPRRSFLLQKQQKPNNSLLRRASVIGMLKEFDHDSPDVQKPAKVKTPSPKKPSASKTASPKTATPAKKVSKSSSPSPKPASPKSASTSPKAATPAKKSPKSKSPSPKVESVALKLPKARSLSPAIACATPEDNKKTPAGKRSSPGASRPATPAKTPKNSGIQTPAVRGRFSVSRISTPPPTAQLDAATEQPAEVSATPKINLKRKSMKSTSKKTPVLSKSAIKVLQRRSGISRASIKMSNCWADIVKFGKPKAQVSAPSRAKIAHKTTKKVVTKPQLKTPARNLKGVVSTGHAESPATIVVGRAHQRTVTRPAAAAPRVITNVALLKKNMKMDEDLSGISDMFKTPANDKKRRCVVKAAGNTETPVKSVIDPSVLDTPEETGEMVVSPLSVASTLKGRRYNSEAVQRLLDGDEGSSFVSDAMPAVEIQSDAAQQQRSDSEAASVTPKQKPQTPGCLSGVKRIMKTPKPKAEPVEDLRGKILKTPKQKLEQEECLSGVKRIMKTPKPKAEPIDDIRGKLLKTPKQKPEQQECLSGVKRIFQVPQWEVEPQELLKTSRAPEAGDVTDIEELQETPADLEVAQDLSEATATQTPKTKSSPAAGVKRIMKTPKEKVAPVEDMVGLKRLMTTPREKGEPVEDNFGLKRLMKSPRLREAPMEDFEGLAELMKEPEEQTEANEAGDQMTVECCEVAAEEPQQDAVETVQMTKEESEAADDESEVPCTPSVGSSDLLETVTQAPVDDHVKLELPTEDQVKENLKSEVEITAATATGKMKTVRGRRAKAVVVEAAQEEPEEPVVPTPVRGRRGKKTEAAAPPAVRQTTRGRKAKTTESTEAEVTVEESAPEPPEAALKPKRGRNARKAAELPVEIVQETVADTKMEPESEQSSTDTEQKESAAPPGKTEAKPKRGRRGRQPDEESTTEQRDVPQCDTAPDLTTISSCESELNPSDVLEAPEAESLPAAETNTVALQKKPVRGRRGKQVEPKEPEDEHKAPEEPAVATPVRGRRGRKAEAEAAAPPAARRRGRNAKSAESASAEPAVEMQPEDEPPTEAGSMHTPPKDASQEENVPSGKKEAVPKPARGRRAKQPPAEAAQPQPEQQQSGSDEQVVAEAQAERPTAAKPRRGKKTTISDAVEQNESAEETAVAVETIQQAQPPVSRKRGRNAKLAEEKVNSNTETTEPGEPARKTKRTRKLVQENVEPTEEVQSGEMDHPEEAVASPAEAQTAVKPKRGRKAKQEPDGVSTEVSTDEPKRGRRGKRVPEETEISDCKQEAEEQNHKPAAEVIQPRKARAAKRDVPHVVPGISESAPVPATPVKRGRRAAVKPTEIQTDDSEDSGSKKSVRWKSDVQVFEIPNPTPVKAAWGRKSKLVEKSNAESKNSPTEADRTEEEDLSGKAAEAQPVKRARRAAKAVDTPAVEPGTTSKQKDAEAETQPKTRRGRAAKK